MSSLARASVWTAGSVLVKVGAGLVVIKLLALSFGPEGVGLAGNYRQLITVLGALAGAGISNGVTRMIAATSTTADAPSASLGTAVTMTLGCSLALALLLWWGAVPLSRLLFGVEDYDRVIRVLALLQVGMAVASLLQAILKGFRDAPACALTVVIGSVSGMMAFVLCVWLTGYVGALVGLALAPMLLVFPACWLLHRRTPLRWRTFAPRWDRRQARLLGKFTLMTLSTAVTLPVSYVLMRNLLAAQAGWDAVGIWQGMMTMSDAWLQFITASFSVWLLPTLSRLTEKTAVRDEILRTLRFVLPWLSLGAVALWLSRDIGIGLLFSPKFTPMRSLFGWQLAGDVLKVGAYVFGYLVVARASLGFYVLAEACQCALLLAFAYWLIPLRGAIGAAQAYLAAYLIYFLLCAGVFTLYCRRA
ncbi:lipid III flippase WzxE [Musicola keenii]|uniref:lipid III flippase WzxE n=1 Tax=Musicola keenii TaxID=2884250 RepID=UPI0017801CB8|nr:lipid III flippase WzxE [Musicola keenii]